MIPSPEVKKLNFADFREIVTRRWWVVAAALFFSFLYVQAAVLTVPDVYVATVRFSLTGKTQGPSPLLQFKSRAMAQAVSKQMKRPMPADELLTAMAMEGPSKEGVVSLLVRAEDPKRAADIANLWVDLFSGEILAKQKAAAEAELKTSREGIAELEGPIKEAARALVNGEMELSQLEEKRRSDDERDRQIVLLKERVKVMEKGRQDLSAKYTNDHPRMIYMENEIRSAKAEIEEKKMQITVLSQEDNAKHLILKRDVEAQKANYNTLINKMAALKEQITKLTTEQSKNAGGPVQIIDRAEPPKKPLPRAKSAGQYFLIGLMIGIAICFAMEYLNATFKIPEEVEFYARMPFLGYVPSFGFLGMKRNEADLFSYLHPDSQAAEAFRNAKVALLFATDESKPVKTILIASPSHREGRTLIASNLAIVFAAGGERTLLIDADMRKGKLGESYGLKRGFGFSDLIQGVATIEQAARETQVPRLSLITSGFIFPHIVDLLSSPAFKKVMEDLKGRFDRIIIDGPPILGAVDNLLLTRAIDGIFFVIAAERTMLPQIQAAKKNLAASAAPIIGGVLNRAKIEKNLLYLATHFPEFWSRRTSGRSSSIKVKPPMAIKP